MAPRKKPLKGAPEQPVDSSTGTFRKVPLASIQPDPANPRVALKQGDPEYRNIQTSIDTFDFVDPIIIDTNTREVIGGHQRLTVLRDAGVQELYEIPLGGITWLTPTINVKQLTKPERTALNVALNNITGDWDTGRLVAALESIKLENLDISITGFSPKELVTFVADLHKGEEAKDTEPQVNRAEELRKKWRTKVGQMWQCGEHRVICGDCTDKTIIERLMGKEKPDCLLTDPPYCSGGFQEAGKKSGSIGTRGTEMIANDTLSTRGYIALIKQVLCVTDPAIVYIFTDWRMWVNLFDCVESSGFGVRNMIVWDKGTPGMGRGWRSQHELIMCGTKVSQAFDPHKAQGNVIQCARTGNVNHPTEKNVELLEKILDVTDMAQVILDPFLGSGTTMIACENLEKKCRGCEIDPGYVAVILQRYKDTFPDKEIRLLQS